MFWGLSPALDMQEEYFNVSSQDLDEINILIIGGCDARHIIKTLAQSYLHKKIKVNIHVIDACTELIARQLVLLYIALQSPKKLGLLEKTRLFMEVYGNSLLRANTSKYMISVSKQMIKMITDLKYMAKMMPIISCEHIKYRERDYMETLFKFWGTGNNNQFNICELWDRRIRNSLGVRYDTRLGVFDWDYNMRLRDMGGATVSAQEFKHFRSTGVAFTWLETEVCRPNYTVAVGVLTSGDNFLHRGYIGDIVTGPYIAYGLDCKDKEMMKTSNGTYFKRSTDITERNIMRIFHEIQTGMTFSPEKEDGDTEHNLGMVTIAMLDAKLSSEPDCDQLYNYENHEPTMNLDFTKIYFHSHSSLKTFSLNSANQNKFQVIFTSYNLSEWIQPPVVKMLAKDGLFIVEGPKFILDMKKDDIKAFGEEINTISKTCGCHLINKFQPLEDSFAKLMID